MVAVAPELDPDLMFHFKKSGAVSVAISKNLAKRFVGKIRPQNQAVNH